MAVGSIRRTVEKEILDFNVIIYVDLSMFYEI